MYAKLFIHSEQIKQCLLFRMQENNALNSHAHFADLFDIIPRWNGGYKREGGGIGSEAEKRWPVFPLTSIFNRLHSLSSRLPPLLPVAALFPQSPIIFSMWSRSRFCTQAHLNMASAGAGNKTIFNRSLHSFTLSLSPPPLTTPIFPRHKPRHHAEVLDSPVASSSFFFFS